MTHLQSKSIYKRRNRNGVKKEEVWVESKERARGTPETQAYDAGDKGTGGLAHAQGGVVVLRQDAVLLRGAPVSLLPFAALVASRPFHRRRGRRGRRRGRGTVGLGRRRILFFKNVRSTIWGHRGGVESWFVQAKRLLQGRGTVSERRRVVCCTAPLGGKNALKIN